MAAAISTAFQSNTAEDENSYKPSRAAPPIPTVAYASTSPARAPEQGERPIFQNNTAQHKAQLQQQQQQQLYHQAPPVAYQQQQQQPQHFSRPSTQQTQAASLRGRHHHGQQSSISTQAEAPPPKKRSNSFSFLRRSSSTQPAARLAQAQQQAGIAQQQRFSGSNNAISPSDGSVTSGSTGLFRARSKDGRGEKNMLRKQSKLKQQQQAELERQQRAREAATRQPPTLPQHNPLPGIETFGGDHHTGHAYTDSQAPPAVPAGAANFSRPAMASPQLDSSSPAYAVQGQDGAQVNGNSDYYEPSGVRSASMTNRGRYSYASSMAQPGNVNSPRRVRRRKDPTPFNVLVIGAKNSGKTSFISFLRNTLALRSDRQEPSVPTPNTKTTFTDQYLETEIDGERVGVTLWDSAGLEKNIVDLQLREMTAFIESKFEDTFSEEQKVIRSPGFRDTHIHCVFLVLDPIRLDSNVLAASSLGKNSGGLDSDLDLQVLKALWGKTTVIPVISKADTLTTSHMAFLKRAVWQSVKGARLNPLDALELDLDDDDDELDGEEEYNEDGPAVKGRANHARQASLSSAVPDDDLYIPMSILSPDPYSMPPYTKYAPKSQAEIGRRYAWGFASPFDPQHCDFIRLRDTIFSEWRTDLRDLSRVKWYEQWRTSRLRNAPTSKSRVPSASISQGIPIRDGQSMQDSRNFATGPRTVPRTPQIDTQHVHVSAPVGVAVTTPGGMEQAQH